jgi:ABC-type Fe3+-siderophore transport system permease subunit
MKNIVLVTYAWATTFLYSIVILWLATLPNLETATGGTDELIKVLYRMVLYAMLFILFYRAIIITLKSTVDRLSKWRSKKEEMEDSEFVLIIETLVVIVTVLATSIFAAFEEYLQGFLTNRNAELKDVLISVMAILLTAIVVYSLPVIGELEIAIKHKFHREFGRKDS